MLGWEISISALPDYSGRDGREAGQRLLANWTAGLGGTRWLDDLAARGLAEDLGGDGYPCTYKVPAGILVRILVHGIPNPDGPFVIGDDYVLPSGYVADARINLHGLRALDPRELLMVEAWDQS